MSGPTFDSLILASASPRRAQLLRERGFHFEQVTPPFDDSAEPLEGPVDQIVTSLALRKARSVAQSLQRGVVIGCDTLLSLDGQPLGKPVDATDARRMLQRLIGRTHVVMTGVCLIDIESQTTRLFVDEARVTLGRLPAGELERYLACGGWRGKAGAYNLAELQGCWPLTIEGDPTTVVGLPMRRLAAELSDLMPAKSP